MRWGKWVIEGFYGQTWSWAARRDMADFLGANGFGGYVYAPKADAYLRREWQRSWPNAIAAELQLFRQHCAQAGIGFGVGLSPFEIYRLWGSEARRTLEQKLDEVLTLSPTMLCLLFDDMRGDFPDIAAIQADIANHVQQYCGIPLLLCPTYYSFDPILEQLFGARPADYWTQLGKDLNADIDILWTGDQVISPALGADGLRDIVARLGRRPVIWDNVIANDGRKSSPFIPLKSLCGRDREAGGLIEGLLFNPMNQPYLAQLVLKTTTFDDCGNSLQRAFDALMSPSLAAQLLADLPYFIASGLEQMEETTRQQLQATYSKFNEPQALDVLDWLQGRYRFDPQCLTG